MTRLAEAVTTLARHEVARLRVCEVGVVRSVYAAAAGDPEVDHACAVELRDTGLMLPRVPVAVGIYSTAFNIFNTALMFPFIGVFDRVLSKIGHSSAEDKEDYSQPRYLDPRARKDFRTGVPAVQRAQSPARSPRITVAARSSA